MILRRISQHVQAQNWVAVTLDLIVVVLGIFVGFQLDRWYEGRRDTARETVYLERLLADVRLMQEADDDLNSVPWALEAGRERARVAKVAVEAIQSCEIPEEGSGDVVKGLGVMSMMPSLMPPRATYEEMISSGALAQLTNAKLKAAISALYTHYDDFSYQLTYYRVFSVHADRVVQKYVDFRLDTGGPHYYELEASFDMPEICNNRELQNAFVGGLDSLNDWVNHVEEINTAIEELLVKLGAELKRRGR